MKNSILYFALAIFCCFGCKSDTTPPQQDTAQVAPSKSTLAPISRAEIINMYETIDYIDYIFFDWDFSMNQSEPNAVKAAVTFISDVGPLTAIPPDCKAIGRMVFQSKGEIIKEADLHYSNNCYFYSFVNEANRPAHHNAMTDQGIAFYQKMFSQAQGQ